MRPLILMLAGMAALGPLATDLYLPAMPAIATSIEASLRQVELSVSIFLLGFSVGQILGGPFSDRVGRRPSILIGLGLFSFSSLMLIFSQHVIWLWVFRFVQAFGGGMCSVNVGAVVRDRLTGSEMAAAMTRVMSVMMIAPIIAPLIGAVILLGLGWRWLFALLTILSAALIYWVWVHLQESRQLSHQPNFMKRYWLVLSHRKALGYLFGVAFTYGSLFPYVIGSPFMYMNYYGLSTLQYPLLFGANMLMMLVVNRVNIRLLNHYQPRKLQQFGQRFQIAMGLGLVLYVGFADEQLWVMVLGLCGFTAFHGLVNANGMTSALHYFPNNSGSASSLILACGFGVGALSSSAMGWLADGTPGPMVEVMLLCAILGYTLNRWLVYSEVKSESVI